MFWNTTKHRFFSRVHHCHGHSSMWQKEQLPQLCRVLSLLVGTSHIKLRRTRMQRHSRLFVKLIRPDSWKTCGGSNHNPHMGTYMRMPCFLQSSNQSETFQRCWWTWRRAAVEGNNFSLVSNRVCWIFTSIDGLITSLNTKFSLFFVFPGLPLMRLSLITLWDYQTSPDYLRGPSKELFLVHIYAMDISTYMYISRTASSNDCTELIWRVKTQHPFSSGPKCEEHRLQSDAFQDSQVRL